MLIPANSSEFTLIISHYIYTRGKHISNLSSLFVFTNDSIFQYRYQHVVAFPQYKGIDHVIAYFVS